jgi:predicted pyridoxine 5'-phosphate oxidase superfamily flavin-nucleotide-binding protein
MTTPPAPPHPDTPAEALTAASTNAPALETLYPPPAEAIQKAVLPHLIGFHEDYLRAATFFCLATGRAHGLDASPRGGAPGFVHVLGPKHIAFADWPGNNRVESLRNMDEDPRAALLFCSGARTTGSRCSVPAGIRCRC